MGIYTIGCLNIVVIINYKDWYIFCLFQIIMNYIIVLKTNKDIKNAKINNLIDKITILY